VFGVHLDDRLIQSRNLLKRGRQRAGERVTPSERSPQLSDRSTAGERSRDGTKKEEINLTEGNQPLGESIKSKKKNEKKKGKLIFAGQPLNLQDTSVSSTIRIEASIKSPRSLQGKKRSRLKSGVTPQPASGAFGDREKKYRGGDEQRKRHSSRENDNYTLVAVQNLS